MLNSVKLYAVLIIFMVALYCYLLVYCPKNIIFIFKEISYKASQNSVYDAKISTSCVF